ncbi:MAG: FAD:protein FMN transferase [Burkholderiales bacterium]|nr:FAD:protein FMN transferase [Burkholderiales bacterium]
MSAPLGPRVPAARLARRRLLGAAALGATGLGAAGWLVAAATGPRQGLAASGWQRHREARPLMGTQVDIVAESPQAARLAPALAAAFERMAGLAAQMSHYRDDSLVAAIGREAGVRPVAVPGTLMAVLQAAQDIARRSGGAFDATIGTLGRWQFDALAPQRPDDATIAERLHVVDWHALALDPARGTAYLARPQMRLDLGGIAKLPILAAGLQALREHGIDHALVNGGGDVLTLCHDDRPAWRVGVRDPRDPARVLGVVALRQGVLASSGDYERSFVQAGRRFHHVLDPATGYPTEGPRGVTLLADDVAAVNGLGAAIMVMGADSGRSLLAGTQGVEALIVERDGALWQSPGMAGRIAPWPQA